MHALAIQVDLSNCRVITPRLQLTPATIASLEAELRHDYAALAGLLSVTVSSAWPPDLYDDDACRYSLNKLRGSPEHADWWTWYILLRQPGRKPDLVGVGGFKGPPKMGVVEIGYGVVNNFQRHGYATEAAAGLVRWAQAHPQISMVVAHTLRLSAALLAAGYPHAVLPLSGITHMASQEAVAENLLLLQLDFLRGALG